MEMPGRVEMRAVVGGELYLFHRPALTVGQIRSLQPVEELQHARQALLVVDILNGRMIARRVGRNVVLQWHGNVDQLSRHCAFSHVFFQFLPSERFSFFQAGGQAWKLNSFAAVRPRMSAFSSSLSEAVARIGST